MVEFGFYGAIALTNRNNYGYTISEIFFLERSMDQEKIGRFIAEKRKEAGLTQVQLAEKLHVTDRAVSKWETGRAMPDSAIMLALCNALGITPTDLLSGEVVDELGKLEQTEKRLIEVINQKEAADKRLLLAEVCLGVVSVLFLLAFTVIPAYLEVEDWLRITLVVVGVIPFLAVMPLLIVIEQTAGYYECSSCGHRYVPTYLSVFFATHMGRTRKMKCPKCNQKSWHKKVLKK